MAVDSKIEWTDATFNGWIGCSKVSPGCANCYAEADMDKRRKRVRWGPSGSRKRTSAAYWQQPLHWNKTAEASGRKMRVFCSSLADVFEDWQGPIQDSQERQLFKATSGKYVTRDVSPVALRGWPAVTMDDVRADLFRLIDQCPHLYWLLLTKRPENIRRMWAPTRWGGRCAEFPNCDHPDCIAGRLRPNVWLMTSVENQEYADARIPELLKCGDLAPVCGLSIEPQLGPVDLTKVRWFPQGKHRVDVLRGGYWEEADVGWKGFVNHSDMPATIKWVIVGGESGGGARPFDIAWARTIVKDCAAAKVPCFVKQLGASPHDEGTLSTERLLRDRKGGDPLEWPEDLRVRQFPDTSKTLLEIL